MVTRIAHAAWRLAGACIAVVIAVVGTAARSTTLDEVSVPGATAVPGQASTTALIVAAGNVGWRLGLPAMSPMPVVSAQAPPTAGPLVLTARDFRSCPPSATACVDLARHLTWLQTRGRVTFGPVRMEPGPPGSVHATPRGTFHVAWKAGPSYISTIYGDPMPWAVFFAPGGIAFHGGSLTTPSHGCVHLTVGNAHYYNEHLTLSAEVIVF
jgi:hypothetical protein